MQSSWRPKPGDIIFRPRRIKRFRLRRVLGVAAVFSAGYGNVGSSIYYALGIVALVAMGATPVALAIAGVLFIFTALTYAEGTAMLPEAGGSASFQFLGDGAVLGTNPDTIPNVEGLDDAGYETSFVWSDLWRTLNVSSTTASNTEQWMNGYLVPKAGGGTLQPTSTAVSFSK